jgi:steroid delta-isomerase-like uncharacterized protein
MKIKKLTAIILLSAISLQLSTSDSFAKKMKKADSVQNNKTVVKNVYEQVINKGDFAKAEQWIEKNYVDHDPDTPPPGGLEGFKKFFTMFRQAFPDLKMTVEDIFGEGDKVVARVSVTGTQKAEFMGIPSSGKKFKTSLVDILRLKNGKVIDHWGVFDMMSMMSQISPPKAEDKTQEKK